VGHDIRYMLYFRLCGFVLFENFPPNSTVDYLRTTRACDDKSDSRFPPLTQPSPSCSLMQGSSRGLGSVCERPDSGLGPLVRLGGCQECSLMTPCAVLGVCVGGGRGLAFKETARAPKNRRIYQLPSIRRLACKERAVNTRARGGFSRPTSALPLLENLRKKFSQAFLGSGCCSALFFSKKAAGIDPGTYGGLPFLLPRLTETALL
jgi:hypothetical protein